MDEHNDIEADHLLEIQNFENLPDIPKKKDLQKELAPKLEEIKEKETPNLVKPEEINAPKEEPKEPLIHTPEEPIRQDLELKSEDSLSDMEIDEPPSVQNSSESPQQMTKETNIGKKIELEEKAENTP